MIEAPGPARLVMKLGSPTVLVNQRAHIECGCSVWIGLRIDNHETVTVGRPCCPEHTWMLQRFNDLMLWSLTDGGTDRPLIDVVDELLVEAAREKIA